VSLLSAAYGRATRLRRSWYERHPQARRSLDRRVISVGNLSVGGSGKTPIVAALARQLVASGERPAILSRGYARRNVVDGVVIASDGTRVLAPVVETGDEPQMLAGSLPGVAVLVSPDRHLAGRIAERRLGCTVMLLDDGFQHLALGRDVDVVVMPASDLAGSVFPYGRLREPLDAASSAVCLLVPGPAEDVARVEATFDRMPVFRVLTRSGPLRPPDPGEAGGPPPARVVAVAGIARPARFFSALRDQGYDVARELAFADHHWYTAKDLDRIDAAVRQAGADLVVTTEKDAARLPGRPRWAALPVEAAIEPAELFASWLRERL
jgi:tetraacyldisaccharide 4'-kinase